MPEIQDQFRDANKQRREWVEAQLGKRPSNVFSEKDISPPINPYRSPNLGESWPEYRVGSYDYYAEILEQRWDKYLTKIEREMLKQHKYGGMSQVVNLTAQGFFEIPEEIIEYDMYSIQANSAMREFLAIGIPTDARAQLVASHLESAAWRQAGISANYLKDSVIDPSVYNMVNDAMQSMLTIPGFGRPEFIEAMSSVMSPERARMIARTEATRARNQGTKELAEVMQSQGMNVLEIWMIAQNTNVCGDCESLNGKIKGNGWTDYPPLHPNCDCDVFLEVVEVPIQ